MEVMLTYKMKLNKLGKTVKGKYYYLDIPNKILLVDNEVVAHFEELYQITIWTRGHYNIIEF